MDNITKCSQFDITYTTENHLYNLQDWLACPETSCWYPIAKESESKIFCKNWIAFSRYRSSITAIYLKKPVGIATIFLMPYKKVKHHASIYFIVSPEYYNRGIGTALLRNIFHLGKKYFRLEKLNIEVYGKCPAISIIEKAQFHVVFRQKHFVKLQDGNFLDRIVYEKECHGN